MPKHHLTRRAALADRAVHAVCIDFSHKPPCRRSHRSRKSCKVGGELRIATFGGFMQESQKKAYFEPFEQLSGIKVNDFAGSDFTKIKAMVDTNTVEWDLAQVSRGSVLNLMKKGEYFEPIEYDLIDPGGE